MGAKLRSRDLCTRKLHGNDWPCNRMAAPTLVATATATAILKGYHHVIAADLLALDAAAILHTFRSS